MRSLLALLLALLLCLLLGTPVLAAEDDGQSAPDLAGGVVTGLAMDRFLNFNTQSFKIGEPVELSGDMALVEQSLQCSVLLDEVVYDALCTARWNIGELDFTVPGDYQVIGTLLPPPGCSFAEGVRQQVVIPIRILPEGKQTVTRIHDYESLICGILLPVGDTASLEQASQERRDMITQTGTGVTEADESVTLVLEAFDDSAVDMGTVGEYSITVQLRPDDEDSYTLAEGLRTLKIPVRVSAPEDFDIWVAVMNRGSFVVRYLATPEEAPTAYWLSSDAALTQDELWDAAWNECPVPVVQMTGAHEFAILRAELTLNRYYYFRLKSGDRFSGILQIMDDGTTPSYGYYLDGDRDSGDGDGFVPPLLTQPAPDDGHHNDDDDDDDTTVSPPSEPTPLSEPIQETQPSAPAASEPAVTEYFDETTDVISGARLRILRDTGDVRFSKQGVMVLLSDAVLDSLSFGERDLFTIKLERKAADAFAFSLSQNDTALTSLPDTQVLLPFSPKGDACVLTLQNMQGDVMGEGSLKEGIATFVIDAPGEFLIVEAAAEIPAAPLSTVHTPVEAVPPIPETEDTVGTPATVSILLPIAVCAGYLLYRKRRRDR